MPISRDPKNLRPTQLRRRLFVSAGLVVALILVGGFYLTRPHRLAAYASGILREMYRGTEPSIESAHFNLHGEIELRGLRLRVPGLPGGPGEAGEIFSAERALLHVDPKSLLTGRPQIHRIIAVRPMLSITQIGPERFNIDILRELAEDDDSDQITIPILPQVLVQDGTIRYGEVIGGEYQRVGSLSLGGRLEPDGDDSTLYHFQLAEHALGSGSTSGGGGESGTVGTRLSGTFDVEDLSVHAELSALSLAHPHRNMLPRQVRDWWDRLEPVGAISGVKFEYSETGGPKAELTVQGVALTIPQLATDGYKARITDVAGTFRFEGDRMHVDGLVGRIEGLRYRIDGTIHGYSPEAPFTLMLRTQPLRIPEQPRYMLALPEQVQKLFRMFSPVGWLSASVTAARHQPGGRIDVRGTATAMSGREVLDALRAAGEDTSGLSADSPELVSRGHYSKFPYELTNVRGLIRFSDESVEIQNLTGETTGQGRVTIAGTVTPPNNDAIADLTITGTNIQIDQKLYTAMRDKHRAATKLFFHEQALKMLQERGHFASQPPPPGTAPFELGGTFDAVVKVRGPAGPGKRPDVRVTVDLGPIDAMFERFPYPVRVTGGRLDITRDGVGFDNIRFDGLHGGHGGVVGHVNFPDAAPGSPGGGRKITPRVGLRVTGFPVDPLLLDVLGEPQARWLRDLQLTGEIDVEGTIFRDADADRIDADLSVVLSKGTAAPGAPDGGGYDLSDVQGRLTVSLDKVQIETLTARHGSSTIELTGEADLTHHDHPSLKLQVTGKSLRFEDPVLDLVHLTNTPAGKLGALWTERQPAGTFDFQAEVQTNSAPGAERYRVTLSPASLSFNHAGQRVELTDTTGKITVDPAAVRIDGFAGSSEAGQLKVSGTWPLSETPQSPSRNPQFAVSLAGERVTPTLLRMLPTQVADALTALRFDGRYHLDIPDLTLPAAGGNATMAGTLTVTDGSCRIGVPIAGLNATLKLKLDDEKGLSVDIAADHLRAADRSIERFTAALRSAGPGVLKVEQLRGFCAGGRIAGHGTISLDDGAIQMRLALTDALLAKLGALPADGNGAARLSASLDVQGSWKEPNELRGRGSIAVRNAHLRGVPLALGLLRVSHLGLPIATDFNSAAVAYYLLHDRMVFESIELSAPSMRLIGNGTMSLPGRRLDITLTTANPQGLNLGPVTRLLAKFRDELVTIRIAGTLDKPVAKVRQLQGLADAWEDVFGDDPPPPPVGKSPVVGKQP